MLLGLRGLIQELILELFNVSSTSESGEPWLGGDQVPGLSHLPSERPPNA